MDVDHPPILPYAIAALAVFLVYRRLRRSFGRQLLNPRRMMLRVAVLIALACSLIPAALRGTDFLFAEIAGLCSGIALGIWGAGRTRFQTYEGRLYYIPHTYSGIAVSLLLIGRLVYRGVASYAGGQGKDAFLAGYAAQGFAPSMVRSPFTVGLLFVLIGYYGCYYSLVMWKSKHPKPEDAEPSSIVAP